eukprot:gnl/Carplike_NY0171/3064_a4117_360.p2 GENE.gnl/Carplike_NY0171/3064_a4117_360~~gnl/Carplike_NY0171/3064_a4117_360.p2  ORF type:complete len:189 (+),score=32.59 gnl/Carplike_NY0171/3064_a4117_360:1181-1747(+)
MVLSVSNNYLSVSEGNVVIEDYLSQLFLASNVGDQTSPCASSSGKNLPSFDENEICFQHRNGKWKVECAYGYYMDIWSMKCVQDEGTTCSGCMNDGNLCTGSFFGNTPQCVHSRVRISYFWFIGFGIFVIFGVIIGVVIGIVLHFKSQQTKEEQEDLLSASDASNEQEVDSQPPPEINDRSDFRYLIR